VVNKICMKGENFKTGDREALARMEEKEGHNDFTGLYDQVVRDEASVNEAVARALKQNPDFKIDHISDNEVVTPEVVAEAEALFKKLTESKSQGE
jgi:hypothetical protein